MAKRHKHKQQKSNINIIVGVVLTALILVAAVVFLTGDDAESATDGQIVALMSPDEYEQQFLEPAAGHLLLDVRTPEEFNSGHIPGAVNISVESLSSRLSEVPDDQPIVVYCRSGNRSATASQILADAGYSEVYDMGGIITWVDQGRPIQ